MGSRCWVLDSSLRRNDGVGRLAVIGIVREAGRRLSHVQLAVTTSSIRCLLVYAEEVRSGCGRGLSASTSAQSCVHFALAAAHVLSQGAVDVRLVAAPAVLARFEP